MSTLLFFDDHFLSVRENVIRRIGRPELIPESVWHDHPRLNPAWGYPSVFFHEPDGVWRLLYQANVVDGIRGRPFCKLVAESEDGLHWHPRDTRGAAKVPRRRFAHQVADGIHEWSGLCVDETAPPKERYRRLATQALWASPDGICWRHVCDWRSDVVDMSAFPFTNNVLDHACIIARQSKGDRRMCVYQTDDWRRFSDPVPAITADAQDEPLTDTYGMPVIPYDGWFVGLLWLYHGPAQQAGWGAYKYTGGKVDCQVAYSLNGLTWQRTQRDVFIPNGEPGSPDAGCVYPSTAVMKPDLDEMWFYASACSWEHGLTPEGAGSILTYRLRKDGFVYLESRAGAGRVATKPMYWRGGELSLNILGQGDPAATVSGYLMNGVRVQITTSRGEPIPGYAFSDCRPFAGDNVAWTPTWKRGRKLNTLRGRDIQVVVELCNCRLYAIRGDYVLMSPQHWRDLHERDQAPEPCPGFQPCAGGAG